MPNVVLVLVALFHLWTAAERHRFEARVAALKAAGQPVRCEDLDAKPLPDDENAAPLLAEATRMVRERQASSFTRLWGMEEATDEEREEARVYINSLGPYFELLAKVPQRSRCYVARDWKKWPDMLFDEIVWIQEASTHLSCRVELDPKEHGRTRRAAEAATLIIDIGERCHIPGLLGYLVTVTATNYYPVLLLRTASRQPGFDAIEFRPVFERKLATPDVAAVHAAFAEERATSIRIVEVLAAGGKTPFDEYLPLKGLLHKAPVFRPLLFRDGIHMLDVFEEAIALAGKSPEEALRALGPLRAKCSRNDPMRPVSGWTVGVVPRVIEKQVDLVAIQRLARVVMALLEYHQQNRAWPESLAALGEMPLDPFSSLPFVYEITDSGVRIRAAKQARDPTTGRLVAVPWEELEEDQLAWQLEG